jgi:hypothetical protein
VIRRKASLELLSKGLKGADEQRAEAPKPYPRGTIPVAASTPTHVIHIEAGTVATTAAGLLVETGQ